MKHTRTTTKRILSVFLALMMIALSLPVAFAATNGITVSTNTLNISVGETGTITYSTTPAGQSVGLSIGSVSHISISQRETYVSVTGSSVGTDTFTLTMTYNGKKYTQAITVNVKAATSHTVTYYSRFGQIYLSGWMESYWSEKSVSVAEGAAIDLTLDLTVGDWEYRVSSDWTFLGWNTDPSATTALTSLTMGTSNVKLYPVYKKNVTATFIDYNGTTKTTRTVSGTAYNGIGAVITKPTQNTMTGWNRYSWWYEGTGTPDIGPGADISRVGDEFSPDSSQARISSDTTYYGLYYRNITLSYDANDGDPTPESYTTWQSVNSYDITAPRSLSKRLADAPTKSNATFDGWAKGSPSGTKYAAGESITISENTTMYATWINDEPTTHTVTYNYSTNGGTSATKTSATVAEGSAIDLTPTATKSGWTFVGWNTNQNATTALSLLNMGTSNVTLYAIFKKTLTGTFIDYSGTSQTTRTASTTIYNNATSGTVTAPTQNTYTGWTKRGWATGTSADASAVSSYSISANTTYYGLYQRTLTLSYNANGGSSTPSSQTGTQYANSYSISSTKNPTLKLANAISKSGSTFDGWSMGSAGGTKYTAGSSVTISANTTMYAVWKETVNNIYNLGEETYSFRNYGDNDANGHCFGMSVTSSGYYLGYLNPSMIGISSSEQLFTVPFSTAKSIICYYHKIQGKYSRGATVAGGSYYLTGSYNLASDWNAVVNYVKNHQYDDKGTLQIGYRGKYLDRDGTIQPGGHAVNFLRYKVVDGQERLYAYDNNYPNTETYFYKSSNGSIVQTPATFDVSIDCIALRDMPEFFNLAKDYDESRAFYAGADEIVIKNTKGYPMECGTEFGEYYMYELSAESEQAQIIPQKDNAAFTYMGQTYHFDQVDDDTYGVLTLANLDEGGPSSEAKFIIKNAPDPKPTEPAQPAAINNACKWCGEVHNGLFGWLVKLIHNILFSIFGAKK
ncbi:MAG: InlB B-repeat-containing protein [Clostridia bacterium]|nr:InlB B-repeat-containing protein [Clostridia bacterium]